MNLPNKLSLLRIILIPFIVLFYLISTFVWGKLIALILFILAVFTDFLDGHIARKYNLITNLGKFLDSIADKMLTVVCFILVVVDGTILHPYGEISLIIIVCREFIVSALRQMGAVKNVVISADMWGKIKANFQFFTIMFFMLYAFLISVVELSYGVYLAFIIVNYSLLVIHIPSLYFDYNTKIKKVQYEPFLSLWI